MRYVSNDRYVWFNSPCNHFGSAKTNFFLYCVYHIKAERKFLLIFFDQSCHFRNHKAADAVVKCAADQVAVCQFIKAVLVSDNSANMDTQFFHFFTVACAAIEPQIIRFGLSFFIVSETGMNSRPAEYSFNRSFFSMNKNTRCRRRLMIHTTISLQV